MAQDIAEIRFRDGQRRNHIIVQIEFIAVLLFTEDLDLVHIDNILPVATHETAALETFLDRLQAASEHIFLHFALAVGVPYHDVIVIRLYIVEVGKPERQLQDSAVVEQCDFLLVFRKNRLI